jgi:cell division septum initiation protein DivIVA
MIWQETGAPYALHMEVEAESLAQLNGLLARLRDGLGAQAARIVEQAMAKATEQLRTVAFEQTPVGATGFLRDTIGAQVSVNSQEPVDVSGYVWWQAAYAPVVEYGSRPHWAPIGPLVHWVERKLHVPPGESYGVARRIQFAIARRGTQAQEFAQRSLSRSESLLERAFSEAADRLARLISGGA